ncbi:MAG TPA: magnesium-transporting ATPase [Actinobacteria bacterium]|nr:magnesium-transporting ATPase [Actinomycetota bacterium]
MTTATGARLSGLGTADVRKRVLAGAVNRVPLGPSRTVAEIVHANVFTLFNLLLGGLLAVIIVVAPPQDALFGGVLVANALIGITQELRAKRTLDRLALLSAPRTTVIREGRHRDIPIDQVVLDDLLYITAGDQIVVDGLVVVGEGLEVDESLLTGEAEPVFKQHADEVLSGSFVSAGSGVFKARRVGSDAYAARLAVEAKKFELVRSELRRGIDWILAAIGWVMAPTMVLLVWSQLRANDEWKEAVRVAVGGMVAMIPQGLVLLTSIAFAVGVVRLGKRHVLVQELPALEMLARVDVVCFDKTGTLTEGRLSVDGLHLFTDRVDSEAALGAVAAADPSPNATTRAIAAVFPGPAGWRPRRTVPFSSARKWSAADFGRLGSWVLGAPEMMLPGDPAVTGMVGTAAAAGKRVLLLAVSEHPLEGEALPRDLTAIALVTLSDVIRPEAIDTVRFFAAQGVSPKVISGDHPDTVAAIARSVGLSGRVVDARSLPEDPELLRRALEEGAVFGRVTPHQKRDMIAALQAGGHVVAMTGDGVNDVLALKKADIGIAMGSGSPASRAVSQVVLLDGNFATLPAVVDEGRRVIANIERVANLFVVKTVYSFLFAVLVGIFLTPFPFVPRHLTLVGTLTIGAPAFALALAHTAARARTGFVIRVMRFAIPVGALAAASTYAAYELAISEEVSLLQARTLATLVLVSIGLFALIINARPLTPGRRFLIGSMAALYGLILVVPPWRTFFELQMPHLVVVLAGVGIIGITGALLYSVLRAVGWLRQVPELLRTPFDPGSPLRVIRTGMQRVRDRATRIGRPRLGEPRDPGTPR